jgi:predicted enzyme related to lactoylglutathione lyase
MDKVVHFEIPAEDLGRAKAFYGDVFDWQLQDVDMGNDATYTTVGTVAVDDKMMPTEVGGINGGMMSRSPEISSPVITVGAVDRRHGEADRGAGGSVATPRTEIPDGRVRLLHGHRGQHARPLGEPPELTIRRARRIADHRAGLPPDLKRERVVDPSSRSSGR